MTDWKINYYQTSSGRFPVKEFIDNLPKIPQSRIYNTLELLAEFGVNLRAPHTKKVSETPLWELRILGESSTRIFYIAWKNKEFLLLHGFTKKTEKTPKKEIKTALARLKEHS